MQTLNVYRIIEGTSVDGPGLRTSIYFAGCRHHCEGCHNPDTWNPEGGRPMTIAEIMEIVKFNDFNVTFTGGDPLLQVEALCVLADEIRKAGKTIWCYTGYSYEEILGNNALAPILDRIDVLVDGRFELALRDIGLKFRGSSNQRIIDCNKSQNVPILLSS